MGGGGPRCFRTRTRACRHRCLASAAPRLCHPLMHNRNSACRAGVPSTVMQELGMRCCSDREARCRPHLGRPRRTCRRRRIQNPLPQHRPRRRTGMRRPWALLQNTSPSAFEAIWQALTATWWPMPWNSSTSTAGMSGGIDPRDRPSTVRPGPGPSNGVLQIVLQGEDTSTLRSYAGQGPEAVRGSLAHVLEGE